MKFIDLPETPHEMRVLARAAAASGLFGLTAHEALRRLLAAHAFGLPDMTALQLDSRRWWYAAKDATR